MTTMTTTTSPEPAYLAQVKKPTMILLPDRARRNLARLAEKAKGQRVRLRPHAKTPQSAQVAQWYREQGVTGIACSSFSMAAYFSQAGWEDITVAFPVNFRERDLIDSLAGRIRLGVVVESPEAVEFLARNLHHPVAVWVKVDAGYGRTGVVWNSQRELAALALSLKDRPCLEPAGVLAHAGQTYHAASTSQIRAIFAEGIERLKAARSRLAQVLKTDLAISYGDTPGCSLAESFAGLDEIRPGTFVFNDLQQLSLGACAEEDLACAVACPVVALHPDRGEAVVYGGAVHLSKDYQPLPGGEKSFGAVARPAEGGWGRLVPGARVSSLSQEHGVIKAGPELLSQLRLGDLVMIVPAHICLAADLLGRYLTPQGETIEMFRLN